jgi:hypothetical protein
MSRGSYQARLVPAALLLVGTPGARRWWLGPRGLRCLGMGHEPQKTLSTTVRALRVTRR